MDPRSCHTFNCQICILPLSWYFFFKNLTYIYVGTYTKYLFNKNLTYIYVGTYAKYLFNKNLTYIYVCTYTKYLFSKNLTYIYVGTYTNYLIQHKASGHFDNFVLQTWFSLQKLLQPLTSKYISSYYPE